jgi:hypothetical protein
MCEGQIGTVQANLPHMWGTFNMMNRTEGIVTDQVKTQW